MSRFPGTLYY